MLGIIWKRDGRRQAQSLLISRVPKVIQAAAILPRDQLESVCQQRPAITRNPSSIFF